MGSTQHDSRVWSARMISQRAQRGRLQGPCWPRGGVACVIVAQYPQLSLSHGFNTCPEQTKIFLGFPYGLTLIGWRRFDAFAETCFSMNARSTWYHLSLSRTAIILSLIRVSVVLISFDSSQRLPCLWVLDSLLCSSHFVLSLCLSLHPLLV